MKAILFDIDGVLMQVGAAVPGASAALEWVRRRDIPHAFITNSTSVSRADLVARMAKLGLDLPIERVLTPAVAASEWLVAHELNPAVLFVADALRADFATRVVAASDADECGAVVVGDLGERWTSDALNSIMRRLLVSPPPRLIALGLTRYWLHSEGPRMDLGPYIKAIEFATQTDALVLGKPSRDYYKVALNWLAEAPSDVLMVGDDQRNDIGGGRDAGMRTMLVRTGKFQESDLMRGPIADIILDSVADLPSWWDRNL